MANTDLASRRKRGSPKRFIAGAIKRPGALTAKAMAAGESPMEYAEENKGASGLTGQQSRFALTLRRLGKRKKK